MSARPRLSPVLARLFLAALTLLAASTPGCVSTGIDGPQLLEPPPGLAFDANCEAGLVLRGHARVRQRCYAGRGESPDWITITELEGMATRDELERARADAETRSRDVVLGPLEVVRIDGRTGFGYATRTTYQGKTTSTGYVAAVPYGTRTYTIEFEARSAAFQDPAFLRKTVGTFTVLSGRSVDLGKVLIGVVLVLGIAFAVRRLRAMEPVNDRGRTRPVRGQPSPALVAPASSAAAARAAPGAPPPAPFPDALPFPETSAGAPPPIQVPPRRRGGTGPGTPPGGTAGGAPR